MCVEAPYFPVLSALGLGGVGMMLSEQVLVFLGSLQLPQGLQ